MTDTSKCLRAYAVGDEDVINGSVENYDFDWGDPVTTPDCRCRQGCGCGGCSCRCRNSCGCGCQNNCGCANRSPSPTPTPWNVPATAAVGTRRQKKPIIPSLTCKHSGTRTAFCPSGCRCV